MHVGRWSAAEAKAKFSEVVTKAEKDGPQMILRNGREAALVVSLEDWSKLEKRRSLLDVMADPSFSVLEPEEVQELFGRDRGPARATSG